MSDDANPLMSSLSSWERKAVILWLKSSHFHVCCCRCLICRYLCRWMFVTSLSLITETKFLRAFLSSFIFTFSKDNIRPIPFNYFHRIRTPLRSSDVACDPPSPQLQTTLHHTFAMSHKVHFRAIIVMIKTICNSASWYLHCQLHRSSLSGSALYTRNSDVSVIIWIPNQWTKPHSFSLQ